MITQKFKGDAQELQMEEAGKPAFDLCSASLDAFFDGCYTSSDFLLAMYDEGRMPFVERVPRASFVSFIQQAIPNFPVTGTFDAYLFILNAVFGEGSGVQFEVPAPGRLEILVNAAASIEYGFQAQEFVSGAFELSDMTTMDGDVLEFRGISGIDSEAELTQLLAELIPAGISPTVTLEFFALYNLVSEDGVGNVDSIVDHLGNQIVLFETGA